MRSRILVAVLGVLFCHAWAGAQPAPPADFREIIRQAKATVFPAVVYIRCVRESHEGGRRTTAEVSGSGVIVTKSGEALTNWHVVDNAISVRCLLSDGRALDAEVVGTDKTIDLALVRLIVPEGESSLPVAELGDSRRLEEGDFVMAMGAPWGLNRSVSLGIISCTERFLEASSEYSLWLQTDAAINPGNSGGPLVDTEGRVIGINTLGIDIADNVGFAIPSETVAALVPHLREHGRVNWSWTGLQLQPLRDFARDMYFDGDSGVIVSATDPQSPARRAGLQPRDRILSINGDAVTALTDEGLPAIRMKLGMLPIGEDATLEVQRGTETLEISLAPREKGDVEGEELDCPRWDLTAKAINQFENEDLYFHREEGVFVYGTKFPGNAGSAGLRRNDIIVSVDGTDVVTLDDLRAVHAASLENIDNNSRLVITVLRGGLMRRVVLDISRDYSK